MNEQNYRSDSGFKLKIEKNKYRISIFGDSFSAGHGIKDINNRFSNILDNKYPNLEVHNFSTNGANTRGNVKRLNQLKEEGYQYNSFKLLYERYRLSGQ